MFFGIALRIILIIALAILTALPFILNFESIAQGIKFTHTHSPLWQLFILWGFPLILGTIFTSFIYTNSKKIKLADKFVLALIITSISLIILPEFFFVKDIYIASHYRANTMFKLTYQAFVMSYLASGYIIVRSLSLIKQVKGKLLLSFVFALLISSVIIYPKFAIKSYYNKLKFNKGLSGETWVKERNPDIYNAILWLRKNVDGQPVILEASGDSYTEYNLISSYTGLPTVSGWFVHEWLWRGDSSFPQKRVTDITQIYTSNDLTLTKSLLRKYNVSYVIIGTNEREKFPNINEEKFEGLGKEVFSSEETKIIQVN